MNSIVFVSDNKLFFDYYGFKKAIAERQATVAEMESRILENMFEKIALIQSNYEFFEIHISLFAFSITALNKHKNFIKTFSSQTMLYEQKLTVVHVYYTPKIIDSVVRIIGKLFRQTAYYPEVVFHSKSESTGKLQELFARVSPPPVADNEEPEIQDDLLQEELLQEY